MKVRRVSDQFLEELRRGFRRGEHFAVLGPPGSGKTLLVSRIKESYLDANTRVVQVRPNRVGGGSGLDLLRKLRLDLGLSVDLALDQHFDLDRELVTTVEEALEAHTSRIVLLVDDVLAFSGPVARALLQALQVLHAPGRTAAQVGALVGGSWDFVPLADNPNSPFRHAVKILLSGLDRGCAREFLSRRQRQPTDCWLSPQAFEFLHERMAGNPHFMRLVAEEAWRRNPEGEMVGIPEMEASIERFLARSMAEDSVVQRTLEELQSDWQALDDLRGLLREEAVESRGRGLHLLELTGICQRDADPMQLTFSSPIWEEFLKKRLRGRYLGDVLMVQGRWREAFEEYSGTEAATLRPLSGAARLRLSQVVARVQGLMVEEAHNGLRHVLALFLSATRYLLEFPEGGLVDRETGAPVLSDCVPDPVVGPSLLENTPERTFCSSEVHEAFVARATRRVRSRPRIGLDLPGAARPEVVLVGSPGAELLDAVELGHVRQLLDAFWRSLKLADRIEESLDVVAQRKVHQSVAAACSRSLLREGAGTRELVQTAVDMLIDSGLYRRAQVALVSPDGTRIQAVYSRPARGFDDINFHTNESLPPSHELAPHHDIQVWTVVRRSAHSVADAGNPSQESPATQSRLCKEIGMKGVIVVPLESKGGVLGTLHLERLDGHVASSREQDVIVDLGRQLGLLCEQAQRLSSLRRALDSLDDEFRLLASDGRVVFLNEAAGAAVGSSGGWVTDGPEMQPDATAELALLSGADGPSSVSSFRTRGDSAKSIHVSTIDDFRNTDLPDHFEADGRIGYVHQVHDSSALFRLLHAQRSWPAAESLAELTARVCGTLREVGLKWYMLWIRGQGVSRRPDTLGLAGADGRIGLPVQREVNAAAVRAIRFVRYCYSNDCSPDPFLSSRWQAMSFDSPPSYCPARCTEWLELPLVAGQRIHGLLVVGPARDDTTYAGYDYLEQLAFGAANAVRDVNEKEQKATESKWLNARESAASIAHQLKNALGPIRSSLRRVSAKLEEEDGAGPEWCRHEIRRAETQLQHARTVVGDFRRYSTERPFRDMAVHELSTVLDLCQEMVKAHSGSHFVAQPGAYSGLMLRCSPYGLREVFSLLVRDSVRHSELSVAELRIGLAASRVDSSSVVLAYTDNGSGVDIALLQKIFEPFYSGDSSGTGLGLTIAKRNIERMGGSMNAVTPESGTGIRVEMSLRLGEGE